MRSARSALTLTEWVVLGVIAEQPTHGWAIVRMLRPGGVVGDVWTSSRALVYRAIHLLTEGGLIRSSGATGGKGPDRTLLAITPEGSASLAAWLNEPVAHVRDLRSELLIKLLLLERRGLDPTVLIRRQLERTRPIAQTLARDVGSATGSGRSIALWRSTAAQAAIRFLVAIEAEARSQPARSAATAGDGDRPIAALPGKHRDLS